MKPNTRDIARLVFLISWGAVFQLVQPMEAWPQEPQNVAPPQKQYAPYPEPDAGYVTDLADLLNPEEEDLIEEWLLRTEKTTLVEIVVVTIGSIRDYPGTANQSVEDFATALFDTYGIGNLPKNDGVLLLIAKNDRKARIELGKYYGRSRDADAEKIIQESIIPLFKANRYSEGIILGINAITEEFAGVRTRSSTREWLVIAAVAAAMLALGTLAISLFRNGKRGWGWICVGLLIVLFLALVKLFVTMASHLPENTGGGSWSDGDFGGGSSGGGGATGSW
jgi:uncharacterized protein